MNLFDVFNQHWPDILMVSITLLTLIILFKILGIHFNNINDKMFPKSIEKIITIENFETHPTLETIPKNYNYDLNKMHNTCKGLSNQSCTSASFCVLLDNEECVGGNDTGPTYTTENNSYIHKGMCYGTC